MKTKKTRGVAWFVTTMSEASKKMWLKLFRHNLRTAPKVEGNQLLTIPCDESGMEFLAKFGSYLNPKWKVRARARGRRSIHGKPHYYYTGRHEFDSHLPQGLADWFAVYITNGERDEVTKKTHEAWTDYKLKAKDEEWKKKWEESCASCERSTPPLNLRILIEDGLINEIEGMPKGSVVTIKNDEEEYEWDSPEEREMQYRPIRLKAHEDRLMTSTNVRLKHLKDNAPWNPFTALVALDEAILLVGQHAYGETKDGYTKANYAKWPSELKKMDEAKQWLFHELERLYKGDEYNKGLEDGKKLWRMDEEYRKSVEYEAFEKGYRKAQDDVIANVHDALHIPLRKG